MSAAGKIIQILVAVGRACVGGVIIYTGAQLLRGEGLLSGSEFDSIITGVFVILLGVYSIFSGVVIQLYDYISKKNYSRK